MTDTVRRSAAIVCIYAHIFVCYDVIRYVWLLVSLFLCVGVSECVSQSMCHDVWPCLCLCVYVCACADWYLDVCLSAWLSVCMSVCLRVGMSVCLYPSSVCLSVCISVSIHSSIHPSIHPSVHVLPTQFCIILYLYIYESIVPA